MGQKMTKNGKNRGPGAKRKTRVPDTETGSRRSAHPHFFSWLEDGKSVPQVVRFPPPTHEKKWGWAERRDPVSVSGTRVFLLAPRTATFSKKGSRVESGESGLDDVYY